MQRKHKSDFHTPHNIFTSRHIAHPGCESEGEEELQCWYFCHSWAWVSFSVLAQVDSSVLQHCTGVLCTVPPPLLSASWPLTETVTISTGLHWPRPHSDPHTQTTTRSHHRRDTRQLSNQANFQIKSHSWRSKYLQSQGSHCIQQQALPGCQISLESQV